MREEVNIDNHAVVANISLWTGRLHVDIDGKRVFNSWKILYIYIVLIVMATILLVVNVIIWYDLGYMMGKDGFEPLFPILSK